MGLPPDTSYPREQRLVPPLTTGPARHGRSEDVAHAGLELNEGV